MEFEIIGKSGIIVMLTTDDLDELGTDFERLSQNSRESQRILAGLLETVSQAADFTPKINTALIEMYKTDEGCIISYSKIPEIPFVPVKIKNRRPLKIYRFGNSSDLLAFIESVKKSGYSPGICPVYLFKGRYYMLINRRICHSAALHILSEYADMRCPQCRDFYEEHGKLICKDAIAEIGRAIR